MIRRVVPLLLLLSIPAHAVVNLKGFWFGSGGYKLAQEDQYPVPPCSGPGNGTCDPGTTQFSTWTITRNWDGKNAKLFGAQNETVGGVLYLLGGLSTANNVGVAISSFSGVGISSGIVSISTSAARAWNTTQRPIQEFYVRYLPINGRSVWYQQEYEARHDPQRFRRPCTTNGNNDCVPNAGTTWTQRPDHDKHYPDIMVPYELVQASSFTVAASSSQAIWFDVYIASSLPAGVYVATITVTEGVTVSTQIPVQLQVYNFALPDQPSFNAATYMSVTNVNDRQYGGIGYNPTQPFLTTYDHYVQLLHAHGYYSVLGDQQNGTSNDFPTSEWVDYLNGAAFTPARGYGNARGIGIGAPVYSIGTYGGWNSVFWSSSTTTGSTGFCTNISSWSVYFANNFPNVRSVLYLADEPKDFTQSNIWSTWLSTSCALSHATPGWVTGNYTNFAASAPYVNNPVTNGFYGSISSIIPGTNTEWATLASSYSSTNGSQAWYYNGIIQGTGMMVEPEDDGISPEVTFWALYKKKLNGYFQWESTNYSGQEGPTNGRADLFNDAKTFGDRSWFVNFTVSGVTNSPTCDYQDSNGADYQANLNTIVSGSGVFSTTLIGGNNGYGTAPATPPGPSGTLTQLSNTCGGSPCTCGGDLTLSYSTAAVDLHDPVNGYHGFDYANGDGVLMYPGTDTVYANPSYGYDGPFASWKLKMHRRGIQDIEYLKQAGTKNLTATNAIVVNTVPAVLWDLSCFTQTDCSFIYGERGWSNDPNIWENARESLAQIASSPPPSPQITILSGKTKLTGNATLK